MKDSLLRLGGFVADALSDALIVLAVILMVVGLWVLSTPNINISR